MQFLFCPYSSCCRCVAAAKVLGVIVTVVVAVIFVAIILVLLVAAIVLAIAVIVVVFVVAVMLCERQRAVINLQLLLRYLGNFAVFVFIQTETI